MAKTPTAFLTVIIKRFMDEKSFKDFHQEYLDARHHNQRSREVTDKDLLILADYRKGENISGLARKFHMNIPAVNTALRIAAVHKLGIK